MQQNPLATFVSYIFLPSNCVLHVFAQALSNHMSQFFFFFCKPPTAIFVQLFERLTSLLNESTVNISMYTALCDIKKFKIPVILTTVVFFKIIHPIYSLCIFSVIKWLNRRLETGSWKLQRQMRENWYGRMGYCELTTRPCRNFTSGLNSPAATCAHRSRIYSISSMNTPFSF